MHNRKVIHTAGRFVFSWSESLQHAVGLVRLWLVMRFEQLNNSHMTFIRLTDGEVVVLLCWQQHKAYHVAEKVWGIFLIMLHTVKYGIFEFLQQYNNSYPSNTSEKRTTTTLYSLEEIRIKSHPAHNERKEFLKKFWWELFSRHKLLIMKIMLKCSHVVALCLQVKHYRWCVLVIFYSLTLDILA